MIMRLYHNWTAWLPHLCWCLVLFARVRALGGSSAATDGQFDTADFDRMYGMAAIDSREACHIPEDFHGFWYQDGRADNISISSTTISDKGKCTEQKTFHQSLKQYLFKNEVSKQGNCWTCVMFFPLHKNALQYKETQPWCTAEGDIDVVCDLFSQDMDLPFLMLFRADSEPVPCPINGQFMFQYDKANGKGCRARHSSGHSCADAAQLKLDYEGCPGSSEQYSDVVQCLGTWQSTSGKHITSFIGKVNKPTIRPMENYRCFQLTFNENAPSKGQLGISADATCREWSDVTIDFEILEQKLDAEQRCKFPHWLRQKSSNQEPRKWESLSNQLGVYHFDTHEMYQTNSKSGQTLSRSTCVRAPETDPDQLLTPPFAEYVIHSADGCKVGFQCLKIHRHHEPGNLHVTAIELQRGPLITQKPGEDEAAVAERACSAAVFKPAEAQYETLLLADVTEKHCPADFKRARYRIEACATKDATMQMGCDSEQKFTIDFKCYEPFNKTYNCFAHWTENGTGYIIAKEQSTHQKACFTYEVSKTNADQLQIAQLHASCQRGIIKGFNGHRVFNASVTEICTPQYDRFTYPGGAGFAQRPISSCLLITWAVLYSALHVLR